MYPVLSIGNHNEPTGEKPGSGDTTATSFNIASQQRSGYGQLSLPSPAWIRSPRCQRACGSGSSGAIETPWRSSCRRGSAQLQSRERWQDAGLLLLGISLQMKHRLNWAGLPQDRTSNRSGELLVSGLQISWWHLSLARYSVEITQPKPSHLVAGSLAMAV